MWHGCKALVGKQIATSYQERPKHALAIACGGDDSILDISDYALYESAISPVSGDDMESGVQDLMVRAVSRMWNGGDWTQPYTEDGNSRRLAKFVVETLLSLRTGDTERVFGEDGYHVTVNTATQIQYDEFAGILSQVQSDHGVIPWATAIETYAVLYVTDLGKQKEVSAKRVVLWPKAWIPPEFETEEDSRTNLNTRLCRFITTALEKIHHSSSGTAGRSSLPLKVTLKEGGDELSVREHVAQALFNLSFIPRQFKKRKILRTLGTSLQFSMWYPAHTFRPEIRAGIASVFLGHTTTINLFQKSVWGRVSGADFIRRELEMAKDSDNDSRLTTYKGQVVGIYYVWINGRYVWAMRDAEGNDHELERQQWPHR